MNGTTNKTVRMKMEVLKSAARREQGVNLCEKYQGTNNLTKKQMPKQC
jgi:hypothetical protein